MRIHGESRGRSERVGWSSAHTGTHSHAGGIHRVSAWSRAHGPLTRRVASDPFADEGEPWGSLPLGRKAYQRLLSLSNVETDVINSWKLHRNCGIPTPGFESSQSEGGTVGLGRGRLVPMTATKVHLVGRAFVGAGSDRGRRTVREPVRSTVYRRCSECITVHRGTSTSLPFPQPHGVGPRDRR